MCERIPRKLQLPALITACVALSLTVARCSPVSTSQSKSALHAATIKGDIVSPIGASTGDPQGPGSAKSARLVGVEAEALEMTDYLFRVARAESDLLVELTSQEPSSLEILQSFRKHHSVLLHFEDGAPESCMAIFGLTATSVAEIKARGMASITTDCVQVYENTWKLSISTELSAESSAWLEAHLSEMTILLNTKAQVSVAAVDKPISIE